MVSFFSWYILILKDMFRRGCASDEPPSLRKLLEGYVLYGNDILQCTM